MFSAVHWATLGILVFLALVLPVAVFGGAPFLPTSRRKLATLLKLAALAPGARAVDLGSGDGRIVAALAQAGFEVTGYEVNPLLVWWSRWRLWRQGLGWSTVRLKDFWSANLAEVDLVVVFGIGSMMPRLAAKLAVELKAGAVVISNGFHVPGWRAEAHEQELYLYRVGSGLSETLTHGTLQATMPNNKRPRTGVGFTLIEVLVVIGIIGVLATMGVVAMNVARQRSYTTRAQADLRSLRNAIALLESDTYKWPNGCPSEEVANPEVNLSTTQAGLIPSPVIGDQGDGCEWAQEDLDSWKGPYIDRVLDPWGNPYYFDPDYRAYENCVSQTAHTESPAVFSFGPNEAGVNAYDCDDIFLELN